MKNNLKKFIGLTSENEAYRFVKEEKKELLEKIVKYHDNYETQQKKLENDFNESLLEDITININDDFYDDGYVPDGEIQKTNGYVLSSELPDKEVFKMLNSFIKHIENEKILPSSVDVNIVFHDSTNKFPMLIEEHEYSLYKRWEIIFENITHKDLEAMLDNIKGFKTRNGKEIEIISES